MTTLLLLVAALLPVATADEAPLPHTYMAFGDSITDGAGSSDETGYRARLEGMLRSHFGRARVINEGRGGTDSRVGARSVAAALERHRPAVTLILYGTNDWRDDPRDPPQPSATANSLRKIVRAAKARRSRPFLATLPPVNVGFGADATAARDSWVARVNARIRELAREEGVVLVDVHGALAAAGPASALFKDGLHPNDEGYAVIARAFFAALTGAGGSAPSAAAQSGP